MPTLDVGTIATIALAGLSVAATSGAVLWRIRAVEKKTDRLDVKLDELTKTVVGQSRFDEHQREDDQRHSVTTTELNRLGLDVAVLKVAVSKGHGGE